MIQLRAQDTFKIPSGYSVTSVESPTIIFNEVDGNKLNYGAIAISGSKKDNIHYDDEAMIQLSETDSPEIKIGLLTTTKYHYIEIEADGVSVYINTDKHERGSTFEGDKVYENKLRIMQWGADLTIFKFRISPDGMNIVDDTNLETLCNKSAADVGDSYSLYVQVAKTGSIYKKSYSIDNREPTAPIASTTTSLSLIEVINNDLVNTITDDIYDEINDINDDISDIVDDLEDLSTEVDKIRGKTASLYVSR